MEKDFSTVWGNVALLTVSNVAVRKNPEGCLGEKKKAIYMQRPAGESNNAEKEREKKRAANSTGVQIILCNVHNCILNA